MEEYKISARLLAEYVFRSGSIEFGFRTAASMTEGTKAHQFVQKQYNEGDQKEVPLRLKINAGEVDFFLEGRCDGLLQEGQVTIVDEIKSTSASLDQIEEQSYPVHWAQAKCYAYMICVLNELEMIDIRLTYIERNTYRTKFFTSTFSKPELAEFVTGMLEIYAPFAKMALRHDMHKLTSAKCLEFPYENFRPGQKKLAASVFRTIRDEGGNLFVNAPTGIGKTISTLFPAVKALGEGYIKSVFYLTARTTTRKAAEEALSHMANCGLHVSSVTLTAKEKICFNEQGGCSADTCDFAKGYYDRLNGAILDIKNNENQLGREVIEAYARKHTLCPFEFSLDLAYLADIVICDYNYIYDPRVSLKRLLDEKKKNAVLLVDEAHNLPDRAREMFSASINKRAFLELKRASKRAKTGLSKSASEVNKFFITTKKQAAGQQEYIFQDFPEKLTDVLKDFIEQAEADLLSSQGASEELIETYYATQNFLRAANLFDERFLLYVYFENGDMFIKIFCLDPADLIKKAGKGYRAKVFFSATLVPHEYFTEMLGDDGEGEYVSIPSPFQSEQIDLFISPTSTRYRDRESAYSRIADTLNELIEERPGNYFCFFPSYVFMERVFEMFRPAENVEVIVQNRQMSEEERESFLANFQTGRNRSLVGFAVMGGIFSEGVDLPGERLNGVAITGVGLPQLSFEREVLKRYYTSVGKRGYDYAYTFPGMIKVLQAGGRLIRSENDTGTILLIDDRFLQTNYLALFPEEWKEFTVI
ncbi:ATP-dependent DNA helicase [Bacillus sp. B-jedd]|uniref:ATP-dependent DNA helicase n=1 Tax=Bacillus sp. B-jedd TaxID=1476857 RepID=UPI00066295B9|nr:ATP-dependent DNA helicase [Bacillus sp. B-jedd]